MWQIFQRDPYAKIDRRKQRAEKLEMRANKRAWKRRNRIEARQIFQKRFREFLSNPFTNKRSETWQKESLLKRLFFSDPYARIDIRKQNEEKKQMRARQKAWRRRERVENWQNFRNQFNKFTSDPFAKRELTDEQREKQLIKRLKRRDQQLAWNKWWVKFKKNPLRIIFPRKKRRTEDGGYLYIYHMTKQERKELALLKRKQNRDNFYKIIHTPELKEKFAFGFLHSTAYYTLSFMLIYLIYQVVTIMVASSFNIPIIWYYYELKFPLYTFSPLYTRAALVSIFAAGPIISLMLAFVFLKLFFTQNPVTKRFQLFFLWGFICGSNMFFGSYISGFFTRTEFIYTSEWLFMSNVFDIEEIIFTVISFIMMLVIGRIVTPLFLQSSGSVTLVKPEFRFFYIVSHVILPWLLGTVILFLITTPNYYFPLILKTITPGLVLIPSLFLYDSLQYENIHRSGVIQRNYFKWSIVIAVIAILFFYRVILNWGLKVL